MVISLAILHSQVLLPCGGVDEEQELQQQKPSPGSSSLQPLLLLRRNGYQLHHA